MSVVIIKPDAIERKMLGSLLSWFEFYRILQMYTIQMDAKDCREHYADHVGKDYYPALEAFMTSGMSCVMNVEGSVADIRATAKRIRTYWQCHCVGPRNLIHASDSEASAEREEAFWFPLG